MSGRFLPDALSVFSAVLLAWVLGAIVAALLTIGPVRTATAVTRWTDSAGGFASACAVAAVVLLGAVRWMRWSSNCAAVAAAVEQVLEAARTPAGPSAAAALE